jgi:hypothetical protein
MMPSSGGRRLWRLAFARATGAPGWVVGLRAARIRALGRREEAPTAGLV